MRGRQLLLGGAICIAVWVSFASPRPTPDDERPYNTQTKSSTTSKSSTNTVAVDFYGESLCPDCQHMVLDILDPLFHNGISDLMTLRYVAYGNVRGEPGSGTIQCQHGATECKYNRYINCAQKMWPSQNEWFPYVRCLAKNMRDLDNSADTCAQSSSLDASKIKTCASGDEGAQLEEEAGKETVDLTPKHTFVPWIVVNGIALGGDFGNLDRYICAAAPEENRPAACYSLPEALKSMPSRTIFG